MRTRVSLLAVSLALVVSGCASLPDYDLARDAVEGGDPDTAVEHLKPLADFGMPEAQVLLGDIYQSQDDPDSFVLAEGLYLKAAETGYVRAYGRLGRLYQRRVQNEGDESRLKEAQHYLEKALDNEDTSVIAELVELYIAYPEIVGNRDVEALIRQSMAEGDLDANYALVRLYQMRGEAEQRKQEIAELCREALPEVPECYLEIAEIYQEQPDLGDVETLLEKVKEHWTSGRIRSGTVWKIANWLADKERLKPKPAEALELLVMIEDGYPRSIYGQVRLLNEFPTLGSTEHLLDLLKRGRDLGLAEVELYTGRIYYKGKHVPLDAKKAEHHFLIASKEIPKAHYYLGNIYREGYLGRDEPRKAVDHYLIAARAGSMQADFALAECFWEGIGIKRNVGYAYSFAKLALAGGHPRAAALLEQIKAIVTPETIALGDIIALREQAEREKAMLAQVDSDTEESE